MAHDVCGPRPARRSFFSGELEQDLKSDVLLRHVRRFSENFTRTVVSRKGNGRSAKQMDP